MTFDRIVTDITRTISRRRQHAGLAEIALPVSFTHEHKIAAGCVIFIVAPDGSYQVKTFDQGYGDIDKKMQQIYHNAFYECDDDLDQLQPLVKAVADQLAA